MARHSAGLLLYRFGPMEVFLVHPGGPYWARKDEHAWSIPKGEFDPDVEDPYGCAVREFVEETGFAVPPGAPVALGEVRQPGGKVVHAWALEGTVDPDDLVSNTFELEWPRGSGRVRTFPEVDRGGWFSTAEARTRMHKGQVPLIDRLEAAVEAPRAG